MEPKSTSYASGAVAPFGFLEILDRDDSLDDTHGAKRLAIVFLGADGFAAFDALFCQEGRSAPFAIFLSDHAFGLNYDRFGGDGLLEKLARQCQVLSPWLLVSETTQPWAGYERILEAEGDRGGMHNQLRYIYRRTRQS